MREREIIELFLKEVELQGDLPLGDDAGAIKLGNAWIVVTSDMLVWGTDVPPIMTPEQAGMKVVIMNLSDVAAMGAKPLGFFFSLGIPRDIGEDVLRGIAKGIGRAANLYRVPVLSGDTNEGRELVIDGGALGLTERPLLRSGARPGDLVCVTGDLGRALAGLLTWKKGLNISPSIRRSLYEKLLEPTARVEEGIELGKVANAAIDVSDGLSKELHILAEMSGVRIVVEEDRIPIGEGVQEVAELLGFDPIELALTSGEEFELVFTVSPERVYELSFDFSIIGRVDAGKGVYIERGGRKERMPLFGWEHFAEGLL
ncbi:thiamine-phosphate kinase [Pyrococcus yayanosii]|uniref:Thiamine-monophosphate kinase n=1 Tax=Pyrococcus yayanosii (strain CH1 / JCM 16557) TaxID=529709 RepID=F8AFI0_PYRYC|nr:thiamine-phosphate kinase [Pyrococcus yayanosii]AEH23795.1 Thiamine monophosphate kinase [Pyrococcus yayanosii CH1]